LVVMAAAARPGALVARLLAHADAVPLVLGIDGALARPDEHGLGGREAGATHPADLRAQPRLVGLVGGARAPARLFAEATDRRVARDRYRAGAGGERHLRAERFAAGQHRAPPGRAVTSRRRTDRAHAL